jgi:ADP-ribosyl-[dinitrogen reductase] hydrolase
MIIIDDGNLPLRVDRVKTPLGGDLLLTHCPGRSSLDSRGNQWARSLESDIRTIKEMGITSVISLLGNDELSRHGVQNLAQALSECDIPWYQFPIKDFSIPNPDVLQKVREALPEILSRLGNDESLLIHCAAGFGRTGMFCATLLVAMGMDPGSAITAVRAARPGTIETSEQERFVYTFKV